RHAHHHVRPAVGEALGGDAAVRLGGPRGMVGMAVVVADDVLAVGARGALDGDELLGRDLVADRGPLHLLVRHRDGPRHAHLVVARRAEEDPATLVGITPARVRQAPLPVAPGATHHGRLAPTTR